MDKAKPSFRRSIKLSFIIIIITLIAIIITLTYFLYSNHKIKKEVLVAQQLLTKTKNTYDKEAKEIKALQEDITLFENIEDKIKEKRIEFFTNAKKYEEKVIAGEGTKKIVYLTIDDGPYSITPSFLDILDQYDVFAAFFLLGKPDEKYDVIYKRIADSGHTIANHTYSHAIWKGLYNSADSFINDVLKQENFLINKLGVKTNIVRFPGGSATAKANLRVQIIERLKTIGYGYIDWNVSSGDGGGNPTEEVLYNNVVNGVRKRTISVVLIHDYNRNTLAQLPNMINVLKNEDCIFLPLFYESSMVKK